MGETASYDVHGVLSWNWCVWTQPRDRLKLALLDRLDWTVAALQEVSVESVQRISDRFPDADIACGVDLSVDALTPGQESPSYGCAVVVRNGAAIINAGVIAPTQDERWRSDSTPLAASLVYARVAMPSGVPIAVVAAHAPHAAGRGDDRDRRVERKVRTYLDLEAWLRQRDLPAIVGIDGNAWIDGGMRDLWRRPSADPADPQWSVGQFFCDGPRRHGLRDTYRAWLESDPARLDEVRHRRPDGPLAVTYVRGTTRKVADRFDAVMASPEFRVHSVEHDYEDSVAAGSDHSYVLAWLGLDARRKVSQVQRPGTSSPSHRG